MKITTSKLIKDLYILEDKIHIDERGSYRQFFDLGDWIKEFNGDALNTFNPHQISASISKKGTMRGFHGDFKTKKLVSCPYGKLQLIVVDVDKESSTYNNVQSFILNENENLSILIPSSCATGHLILTEKAMFHYLQNTTYGYHDQFTLSYKESFIFEEFIIKPEVISLRDENGTLLKDIR